MKYCKNSINNPYKNNKNRDLMRIVFEENNKYNHRVKVEYAMK